MTISKVKPDGWGTGAKVTSGQLNGFDTKLICALDKTAAGDTLYGIVNMSGVGRFLPTVFVMPNANTTHAAGEGSVVHLTNGLANERILTLDDAGASERDILTVFADPSMSVGKQIFVDDTVSLRLATIGNGPTADAQWCDFIFLSGAWRVFRRGVQGRARYELITASGTWMNPVPGFTILGCGGGGGGGAGGNASTTFGGSGGGGGGAPPLGRWDLTASVGTTFTIVGGAGGNGGSASPGSAGGDLTFDSYVFPGGDGGSLGANGSAADQSYALGGAPVRQASGVPNSQAVGVEAALIPVPGRGGAGVRAPVGGIVPHGGNPSHGWGHPLRPDGAPGGINGIDTLFASAGGAGGGGGASGWPGTGGAGTGGQGGQAGHGVSGTAGLVGGNATEPGCAGGGGGSNGFGTGAGAAGGNGADGRLLIGWVI